MPACGSLSHIDISVGYPDRSIPFYQALLTSLGYKRWQLSDPEWSGPSPRRATWSIRQADGSVFGIEVRPAREDRRDRRYDRYEPGPHHLAFHADSNETVARVHQAVTEAGGEVLDPPTEYGGQRGYGDRYFAAFFADPDGVKLEVCYVPGGNP